MSFGSPSDRVAFKEVFGFGSFYLCTEMCGHNLPLCSMLTLNGRDQGRVGVVSWSEEQRAITA